MEVSAEVTTAPSAGDRSLGDLLLQWWRGKWIVGGVAFAFILGFGAMAFLSAPVFRATTWLVSAESQRTGSLGAALGSLSNLAAVVGIDVGAGQDAQTQEALAVLHSRAFRESFIEDLDLMPQLFKSRWDASSGKWKDPADPPTMADAIEELNEMVVISRDPRTNLYRIQIEWTDPSATATWVNTMVSRVNAEMRERAIRRSTALIDHLEQELARTNAVATRDAISQLLAAQVNERMFASVTSEYAFTVVERAPVPDRKVRPRKGLQLMLGAITGGFIGSVFVLLGGPARRAGAPG